MAEVLQSPVATSAQGRSTLHVTALDAIVNVNSLFSGVIFIGLAFSSNAISLAMSLNAVHDPCGLAFSNDAIRLVSSGANDSCNPASNTAKRLVLCEVLAFSAYLLSSLIAQGLKLQLALIGSKKAVIKALVPINEKFMRMGMAVTALGTAIGTVCLTLSIIFLIELLLGALSCTTSAWSKGAAIPLIICVSCGVVVFLASVFYAFFVNDSQLLPA